ncbi:MAG: DUF1569 domain-containing protein [Saprospiraceae bacterium]
MKSRLKFKNFDEVLIALEKMEQYPFKLKGDWDAYQHLMHCSQSLQLNVTGYPLEKSPLFQQTIGKVVFFLFNTQGSVSHNTNAFTEGTDPIHKNGLREGVQHYRKQIIQFLDWSGPLKAHAFFGKLSKQEIIHYHSMHFANHFEQFEF